MAALLPLEQAVVPAGFGNVPADMRNRAPFSPFDPDGPPEFNHAVPRYQQVYGDDDLTAFVGQSIRGIAFRVDELPGSGYDGAFLYERIQLRLSTTPRAVDGLSADLDSNVGADETVVFDGRFALPDVSGGLSAGGATNPFSFGFRFDTPFPYSGGNLLLDVHMPDETPPAFYLDAAWQNGAGRDELSRAYVRVGAGPVVDTLGLVTLFVASED